LPQQLNGGPPHTQDVLVGELVRPAERTVAESFAPGLRASDSYRPGDRRLSPRGRLGAWKARPRKVLRPGRMVVVGVDLCGELIRSTFPDVVPQHGRVLVGALPLSQCDCARRIAAVAVGDQEAPEPLPIER